MADHVILERLEFQGHIGVTAEERRLAQPIRIDLELEYPAHTVSRIAASDDISSAVDYARVAKRVVQLGSGLEFHLLETLAERICLMLFAEFSFVRMRLWVRKLRPPVNDVHGSAGVRLERMRTTPIFGRNPAHFLIDQWQRLPRGRALDLAAGHGRNALFLAAQGFTVDALDRDEQALAELAAQARAQDLTRVSTRIVDLEQDARHPPELPKERYEVILVFFYLFRPIFPALFQAMKPGGILMYETFLIENHLKFQHPRRREFCLKHNELLQLAPGLRVLYYEEGAHEEDGADTAFTARLLAQKEMRDASS